MKTTLLKMILVVGFLALGAFTAPGNIPDDADGDGVPDSVDVCPGEDASGFDRNGDGCIDEFIGTRHIEYWSTEDATIGYVINVQGVPAITNGSDLTAVQNAVNTWMNVPDTELNVVYGGTTTQTNSNGLDRINLVTFVDTAYPFSNLVLAVGLSTSFEADTVIADRIYQKGEIFDADMVFNPTKTFKTGGAGPGVDIQSVAAHEAGHLFGISHSAIQSSTMFYVLPGGNAARTLELDDELVYFKAYGEANALATSHRIDGVVTNGQTDQPVAGAGVFLKLGQDTVGCDYTLPNGSFSFPGLAAGNYTVRIHPIDGTADVGFIQPANINVLMQAIAVENFVEEGWDEDESATDEAFAATPIVLNAGNPTESIEIITNIDAVAPTVIASNPSNNTNDVAIDAAYIVSFSEPLNLSTISDNFEFREQSSGQRRGGNIGVIEEGRRIIFTPNPPLAFDETYTMTLATGLEDEFGNGLASPFTLTITTEQEPPVSLTSLSPNKGVLGTTVVITGRGFDTLPLPTVAFGAEIAVVTSASPTTLVVTVPATAQTSSVTVTNSDLEVTNPLTFTVLTTAEVARGFESGQALLADQPNAIAVVPDGGYAYVATDGGVEAIVVDPSLPNYLISTPIAYAGGVDAVYPTPTGRRVYGVSTDTHELIEINSDPTTGLLFNTVLSSLDIGAAPKGVLVEPSGYRAFVATDASEIQVWDIKLGSATYQEQVNALTPGTGLQGAMAVTPSGDQLLALTDSGNLLFYSVPDESLLTSVSVGADPRDVIVEPVEQRAYVMHSDGRISVVNIAGVPFKVQDIATGGSLRGAAVTPAGRYIYASDRELDNLKIVDLDESSPTFRSVVEDIEAPTNPVDVALTPDGVYALSLLQGDGAGASTNPSRLLVTTIGAGPALHSVFPQAARIGARIVLGGDSFGDGQGLDVAMVDFNGVLAAPVVYQGTHITVVVPPGATSGPISVHVDRFVDGPEEISNALAFQVLTASPVQTNVREAATIENAAEADFEAVIAMSPDGNTIYVGTSDGHVIVYDVRPGSPTFHQEINRFQYYTSAVLDLAISADGKTGYAVGDGDAHIASFHAVPSDPDFGETREFTDLGYGPLDQVETSPDNRVLLIGAGDSGVRIMGIANHFDNTPMIDLSSFGTGGALRELAFHPSGMAVYAGISNPEAILTVDMDETGIEFGLVQGVYEFPGAPAPTPMSIAVYPDGSKLLALSMQLQGPNTRTIFEYNINNAIPTSLASSNTFTPSGTAGRVYQERIRISPKADVGLRAVESSGFQYFNIANPGGAINTVGLLEVFVANEFEFTPDGNRAYMASAFHDSLRVYDFTPADNLTLASGNNQTGVAGQLLPALLRTAVGGHINDGEIFIPVVSPGIPVTYRVVSGGGMLRVGDTESDVVVVSSDNQGFAQIAWRLGPSAGTQTVTARSSNLFGSPVTFNAIASPDPGSLPLTISEVIPLNDTPNVSVTTAVLATFSRAVSPASIGSSSFYLQIGAGGALIPAAVGFTDSDRRVSLTPIESLPYDEQIRVVYTASIQDALGGVLTTPGFSSFETQVPPPPHISSIYPPSALPGVGVTISGAGFDPVAANNTVNFAGVDAVPLFASTNSLRVTVPATAISGNVNVTVGAQTSNNAPFTVLVPNTSPIDDVISTIGTGNSAKSIVVSADGALCYTVGTDGDVIIPVDIEGETTFPSISVGDQPVAIVMHPDGRHAYVANFNSGSVSVIDTDPSSLTFHTVVQTIEVGTGPIDLAVTPEGDRVVVANATSSDLSVIDGDPTSITHNQVVATIGAGSSAKSIVVSADGTLIYVGTDTGFIVIATSSYSVTATIGTGSSAKSIVVSADGTLLFILTTAGNVLIVDISDGSPSQNQVVATIGAGSSAKSIVVSADGTLLYIVQENSSDVLVVALDVIPGVGVTDPDGVGSFTVETHVVGTLHAGDDPSDVAIDPAGSGRVIVANAGDRTLTVFGPGFGPLEAYFEITPHTLNTQSNGKYVSGIIQVAPPRNVHEIDLSTVRVFDTVYAVAGLESFGDKTKDGIEDVTVRFCRQEFIAALPENGEYIDVTVKATIAEDELEGTYVLRVLRPNIHKPGKNQRLPGGQSFVIEWESPKGLNFDTVNIEWTAEPVPDDDHHGCEGDDVEFEDDEDVISSMLTSTAPDNVEVEDDIWQTIAHNVANTGSFTWQVPLGYVPDAHMRVTLVSRGKKAGESIVPFMIEMPVPVRLKSFDVTMDDGAALLRWETTMETGMQGYQIVRAEQELGRYDAVTKNMIESSGSASGGSYEYRDESISANRSYWYKLREVADDGLGAEYGPYKVTFRVTNRLDQNVPNPFNPTTTIAYAIASDNNVSLTIYDVAGRKVRSLVNERQKADVYKLTWDGANDAGQRVASGVYFYKLVAGKFTQTKKMVLLK